MIALRKSLQKIERNLEAVLIELKTMYQFVDAIDLAVSGEKPRKAPREKRKAKARRGSATAKVLSLIEGSKDGVSTDEIIKRSGMEKKAVYAILTRAKKTGKVRTPRRGFYVMS